MQDNESEAIGDFWGLPSPDTDLDVRFSMRAYLHDPSSERYPAVAKAILSFLKNHSGFEHREHHARNGSAELIRID